MAASDHWACAIGHHAHYRQGEHSVRLACPIATGHNPSTGPRDCYTCKQAATKPHRGATKQRADKEHFACALMPWEHDPPNQIGALGGHRNGCPTLPGHERTPGKGCPGCRRRYAGYDGLSPMEFTNHPHYDCRIPMLDHEIKPRVGHGHRPGCRVAAGHAEGGVSTCRRCFVERDGPAKYRTWVLGRTYRLTKDAYNRLLRKQEGVCAICGKDTRPLRVDHDHATGVVRGLLCHGCNIGLGNFQDDFVLLRKAARYLLATKK